MNSIIFDINKNPFHRFNCPLCNIEHFSFSSAFLQYLAESYCQLVQHSGTLNHFQENKDTKYFAHEQSFRQQLRGVELSLSSSGATKANTAPLFGPLCLLAMHQKLQLCLKHKNWVCDWEWSKHRGKDGVVVRGVWLGMPKGFKTSGQLSWRILQSEPRK